MLINRLDKIEQLYELFLRHDRRISTDSRSVEPGALFFALRGEAFNGNSFAVAAIEAGACAVVVDNPELAFGAESIAVSDEGFASIDNSRFSSFDPEAEIYVVHNALTVLQQLATYHRRQLGIPILAITGSNGKTTTKELISRVLSCNFRVAVTQGNLNNHIGLPLTLLGIGPEAQFGIVEMGASACGEIDLLCQVAQPNYGLITNIGRAHLEGFGGVEGVKRGKGELYDYLWRHDGLAFYLADDEVLREMVDARQGLRALGYSIVDTGGFASRLVGGYNRYNVASAVALGRHFGVADDRIAEAIMSYIPADNRSQLFKSKRNTLIMDFYNANGSSMGVALDNFDFMEVPPGHFKIAILGDMLELGEWSAEEHKAVVKRLQMMRLDAVYLVGSNFTAACDPLRDTLTSAPFYVFPSVDLLKMRLRENPIAKALILMKASHGLHFERLVENL